MLKTYAESATEYSIFVISTSIIHQEKKTIDHIARSTLVAAGLWFKIICLLK